MSATEIRQIAEVDLRAAAREIADAARRLDSDSTSSDLVYTPSSAASFYQDAAIDRGLINGDSSASERLSRHAEQMERLQSERDARHARRIAGGYEVRVEPNLTDGTGGYFSPPAWLNQLFATAVRPRRVLANLIRAQFPLPRGASQVSVPLLNTGTSDTVDADDSSVGDTDITDGQTTSAVVAFTGQADVALQLLEMSPSSASLDWALFKDLGEAYDAQLEAQLINGTGVGMTLLGVLQAVAASNQVTYTDASPTGSEIYPLMGQAFAHVGNNRDLPPECWLLRSARWAWMQTSEDLQGLPFGIAAPMYLGKSDDTPDPIGGLLGLPAFLDDAIPATLSTSQDAMIALRPSDQVLFESDAQTNIYREPLSSALGARIQMHGYAAALTGRYPTGIATIEGTGMALPSPFNA